LQQCLLLLGISDYNTEEGPSPKNLLIFSFLTFKRVFQISVQFQIMQSAIYISVVTHVLTPAILSHDSLQGLFSFAEYKAKADNNLTRHNLSSVCVSCLYFQKYSNLQWQFVKTALNSWWCFMLSFIHLNSLSA